MFSDILKSFASVIPIPSVFWTVASAISLSITSISLESSNLEKTALAMGAKPTRVYTIPSPTVLAQDNTGLFSSFLLVLSVTIIILASVPWTRSPRLGARLKRQAAPPPPPPPPTPPPAPLGPNAADINNGEGHDPEENGGGDGDDPHVEDGGVDESKDVDDDGFATAAAPAPEDPPPPPGSVDEEDDDGGDVVAATQGGLPWVFLLLVISLAASRTPAITVKVDGAVPNPAPRNSLSSVTIPGLLERLGDVTCKASSSIPQLLAKPRIPPSPLSKLQVLVALELDPPVPVVAPQQVSAVPVAAVVHVATAIAAHVPAAVALPSPAPTIRQVAFVAWRKTFVLFAGIPGLVLLGGMFRLLLPLGSRSRRTENEALESEPPPLTPRMVPLPLSPPMTPRHVPLPLSPPTTPHRHRSPPAPPSSPISPRRQRPLAPLPFRDAATKNICDNMVYLVKDKTARRIIGNLKAEEKENVGYNASRERRRRVSAVQRKIWQRLYELRARDDEERGA